MKKSGYLILMVLIISLMIGSCKKTSGTGSLYVPSSTDATSTATLSDLQQGRTLYINNCNSCHGLYSPDDYSAAQWRSIVSNMALKTGLSTAETVLVTKYVTRGK
jgi:mono/diheme cytochrome c family protein